MFQRLQLAFVIHVILMRLITPCAWLYSRRDRPKGRGGKLVIFEGKTASPLFPRGRLGELSDFVCGGITTKWVINHGVAFKPHGAMCDATLRVRLSLFAWHDFALWLFAIFRPCVLKRARSVRLLSRPL